MIETFQLHNVIEFLQDRLLLGFGQELLIIVGTLVLRFSYEKLRKDIFLRRLCRAFGTGIDNEEGIKISVPVWQAIEGDRAVPRFSKVDKGHLEKYYGPSSLFSIEDARGANKISAIFEKILKKTIYFTGDDQEIIPRDATVIMIGSPLANFHARADFSESILTRLGGGHSFFYIEENNVSQARAGIRNIETGKEFFSDIETDYGVVQRKKSFLDDRSYVFLCGGIGAAATRGACEYLSAEWPKFAKEDRLISVLICVNKNVPSRPQEIEFVVK